MGMNNREISNEFDISRNTVCRMLKETKIRKRGNAQGGFKA